MVQIIKETRSHGIFAISQAVRTNVQLGHVVKMQYRIVKFVIFSTVESIFAVWSGANRQKQWSMGLTPPWLRD